MCHAMISCRHFKLKGICVKYQENIRKWFFCTVKFLYHKLYKMRMYYQIIKKSGVYMINNTK